MGHNHNRSIVFHIVCNCINRNNDSTMTFWEKLFGGGNILKQAADVADRFIDTKEDKRAFFTEIYSKEIEERNKAREMYKTDNIMQKVYAATFLIGYLGLTGWLIYAIVTGQIKEVNQFETGMIGSIWGAMSSKVNTVTDFFFGSSDPNQNSNKILNKRLA